MNTAERSPRFNEAGLRAIQRRQHGLVTSEQLGELERVFPRVYRSPFVPVTSPARTIIDIAAVLDGEPLEAALEDVLHRGRVAHAADRRRLAALVAAGWSIVPVTWDDCTTASEVFIERVRAALLHAA